MPVPAPLRRTKNEEDARYILDKYTYTEHSLFEVCTPVLRLEVRFGVLALASSVEFCKW